MKSGFIIGKALFQCDGPRVELKMFDSWTLVGYGEDLLYNTCIR